MSVKRWPSRNIVHRKAWMHHNGAWAILLILLVISIFAAVSLFLRALSTELAVSIAKDAVISAVSDTVNKTMQYADSKYGALIHLEKDKNGNITAITTDSNALNALASDILISVSTLTGDRDIEISIPIGSLTGSTLLLNRGFPVKIKVHVLSSAFLGYNSEVSSIGINQSRHQILFQLREEITLIMPWRNIDTDVQINIPVAETIIVGQVPQSYINIGE